MPSFRCSKCDWPKTYSTATASDTYGWKCPNPGCGNVNRFPDPTEPEEKR